MMMRIYIFMGRILIALSDEVEAMLRQYVGEKYGYRKGSIRDFIEEAIMEKILSE